MKMFKMLLVVGALTSSANVYSYDFSIKCSNHLTDDNWLSIKVNAKSGSELEVLAESKVDWDSYNAYYDEKNHQKAIALSKKSNKTDDDWLSIKVNAKSGSELEVLAESKVDWDSYNAYYDEKNHQKAIALSKKSNKTDDDWLSIKVNAKSGSELEVLAESKVDWNSYNAYYDEKNHQKAIKLCKPVYIG
mgnify:CR=1 FL=1